MNRDFWFMGQPYRRYKDGMDEAARLGATNAGLLMKCGVTVFAPIPHSHFIARAAGIDPTDNVFWLQQNAPFIYRACGLIVLELDGWEKSDGLTIERAEFAAQRKPIVNMKPGQIPKPLMSIYA